MVTRISVRDLCQDARIEKIEKKSERRTESATLMTRRDLGELSRSEFLQRVSFPPCTRKEK